MSENKLRESERIRNNCICEKLEVVPGVDKMTENCLRQFGHVQHRPIDEPLIRSNKIVVKEATRTGVGLNEHGRTWPLT